MGVRMGEGYESDRLPWLETVEEDYRGRRVSGRAIFLVLLLVALVAAAAGAYYLYSRQQGVQGNGELIEAEPGEYKIKPQDPGGMQVDGEGDTLFATSQGDAGNASINVGALPEAPVEGQRAAAPLKAGAGTSTAKIAVPNPRIIVQPKAAAQPGTAPATGSGSVIQLGAFPTEGGANTAWARLSKRFAYLAPLGKSVERAEKDGKAIFRLRVNAGSNGQARELCGKLKVAGENCFVAN